MTQQQQIQKELKITTDVIEKIETLIDWTQANEVRNYLLIECIKILDKDKNYLQKCLNKLEKQ